MKQYLHITAGWLAMALFSPLAHADGSAEAESTAVSRKVLERHAIAGGSEELRLMLVEFPPGYSNVAHTHPVAGVCYVVEGVAESQYAGDPLQTFRAGESYQDSAEKTHLIFRNPSLTQPLKFLCAAKIGRNQEFMQPLR